jgi:hypothetical protein
MLVPAVLKPSTSPSPAKVPPVICTVAPERVALSGSAIARPPDRVVAAACSV